MLLWMVTYTHMARVPDDRNLISVLPFRAIFAILKNMAPELQTLLWAMTPIGGMRVSLPIAITIYQMNWISAYLISVVGNSISVVLLLLFLEPISGWFSRKFKIFRYFFSWFFARTRKKYNSNLGNADFFALTAFVALPFPLTGGWTTSLIAFLFNIPFKKALLSITLGNIIAGLIILWATKAGIAIEKYFGWSVLAGMLILIAVVWLIYERRGFLTK